MYGTQRQRGRPDSGCPPWTLWRSVAVTGRYFGGYLEALDRNALERPSSGAKHIVFYWSGRRKKPAIRNTYVASDFDKHECCVNATLPMKARFSSELGLCRAAVRCFLNRVDLTKGGGYESLSRRGLFSAPRRRGGFGWLRVDAGYRPRGRSCTLGSRRPRKSPLCGGEGYT